MGGRAGGRRAEERRVPLDDRDAGRRGRRHDRHAHLQAAYGTFRYGLSIVREQRRKGYASEAIHLVLAYFFRELRYQKVNVEVYAFNEPSLRLHLRLGFREEGRLRRMIRTAGAYHDEIILGMTVEEFEAGRLSDSRHP
jgi:RimJ/RimL family protein N-acetyltransferase